MNCRARLPWGSAVTSATTSASSANFRSLTALSARQQHLDRGRGRGVGEAPAFPRDAFRQVAAGKGEWRLQRTCSDPAEAYSSADARRHAEHAAVTDLHRRPGQVEFVVGFLSDPGLEHRPQGQVRLGPEPDAARLHHWRAIGLRHAQVRESFRRGRRRADRQVSTVGQRIAQRVGRHAGHTSGRARAREGRYRAPIPEGV